MAARNAGLRTHMLTTPEPSLMRSVDRAERGERHRRLAHEPALGLPHRLEARRPRPGARSACRRGSGGRPGGRGRHAPRLSRSAIRREQALRPASAARARISVGVDPGRARLVEHDLAVDLDPQRAARPACTRGATAPSARTTTSPRSRARLGHQLGARSAATSTRRSGATVDVVGAGEREREAELLEHVGADAVGAERDAREARAGRP